MSCRQSTVPIAERPTVRQWTGVRQSPPPGELSKCLARCVHRERSLIRTVQPYVAPRAARLLRRPPHDQVPAREQQPRERRRASDHVDVVSHGRPGMSERDSDHERTPKTTPKSMCHTPAAHRSRAPPDRSGGALVGVQGFIAPSVTAPLSRMCDRPTSAAYQPTLNWPMSMLSSCSRMWQWNM